ncbi:hypothetical protein [Paraburkholderia terrae]|uniref:hypothetical protein n=1 Tax=Paraburkholderia terrae TaxID=311230 RepID=UPI0012E09D8E|nr:hypothetical protein [Paraburkholderia terrae]
MAQYVIVTIFALDPSCLIASSVNNTGTRFYRIEIPDIAAQSIADFGYLNAPLTEKDRLEVCGTAFCKIGASTPIRLFGVNLGFDAALPDQDQARRLAIHLRCLGVNLVRLHALDSISSSDSGNATALLTAAPFPSFNQDAIFRLRNLLEQFRQQGIYADLNLHVVYQFRPTIDHTIALDDETALPNQSKPFLIVDDLAIQLQARYARGLLDALKGAGEPALALVEINNESSLIYAWMNGDLHRLLTGPFKDSLMARWQRFAATKTNSDIVDPKIFPPLDGNNTPVQLSFLKFLSQEDKRYVDFISNSIRDIAPRLLIIGTQMSFGGLINFTSMSEMDALDNHFYVDHYHFPNKMWRWDDWQITDSSSIKSRLAPLLSSAYYRSFDKPYLITEFNQPWPNRQSAEILPETAVFASMQDWSGLAFYDYTHSRADYTATTPREFSLVGDATKLVQFGQAAWLFRTRAVAPLCGAATYTFDDHLAMVATRQRITNDLANFLQQEGTLTAEAPLAVRVGYSARNLEPPLASCDIMARFDLKAYQMIIDASTVKGITGYVKPNEEYDYRSFRVTLRGDSRGFLSLMLSARDGLPVEQSHQLLLTLPGYTVTSFQTERGPAPLDLAHRLPNWMELLFGLFKSRPIEWNFVSPLHHHTVNLRSLTPPVWMEYVPCTFTFRSNSRKLIVYPLSETGARMAPLQEKFVKKISDGFSIDLQSDSQPPSPWYELDTFSS